MTVWSYSTIKLCTRTSLACHHSLIWSFCERSVRVWHKWHSQYLIIPDDDCDVGLGAGSDASASGLSHVIGPLGFVNTLYRSDPHSSVDAVWYCILQPLPVGHVPGHLGVQPHVAPGPETTTRQPPVPCISCRWQHVPKKSLFFFNWAQDCEFTGMRHGLSSQYSNGWHVTVWSWSTTISNSIMRIDAVILPPIVVSALDLLFAVVIITSTIVSCFAVAVTCFRDTWIKWRLCSEWNEAHRQHHR